MISVIIKKQANIYTHFQVTGHANYDEYGSDIVCASVSTLVFYTMNLLEKFQVDRRYQIKDNLVSVDISDDTTAQLIIDQMVYELEGLSQEYSKYIDIKLNGGE